MFVNKSRNPSASEILSQLFLNKELRSRVLTTLGLLLLVRLGIYIPMPGIDRVAFKSFIDQGGQLIGFLDIFTGGGISTLGIFALGILPFINAYIIIQLLTASLPVLEDLQKIEKIKEVRLKVFLKRDSDLSIPSLYKIFKGSDWQERETFDMYGINFIDHPNPKRLLMPEDWRGWPLRKDYIQPDFYELQDAY